MNSLKHRPYTTHGSNPPAQVPETQRKALDRKHALDDQQRHFATSPAIPGPHLGRGRPPG